MKFIEKKTIKPKQKKHIFNLNFDFHNVLRRFSQTHPCLLVRKRSLDRRKGRKL
jgi:hypothetical protein